MNKYYFTMLGLKLLLQTPNPLEISQRLLPFVSAPHKEGVDCTIRVQIKNTLPQPEESGLWHGLECYDHKQDALRIFHCHSFHAEPFAVTIIDGKGNIAVTVQPDYADYFSGSSGLFNRIGMENMLLQHSGLLLHASLIKYADSGIAFTGPSGIGKSTQADLWEQAFGAEILNGDRAALRKTPDGWVCYGSPYAGTSGIYKNENAPLKAIVILRQAPQNSLRPIGFSEAFPLIWPELSLRRWDADFVEKAMELCGALLADVPVYLLECLPEESAAKLLKEGLSL